MSHFYECKINLTASEREGDDGIMSCRGGFHRSVSDTMQNFNRTQKKNILNTSYSSSFGENRRSGKLGRNYRRGHGGDLGKVKSVGFDQRRPLPPLTFRIDSLVMVAACHLHPLEARRGTAAAEEREKRYVYIRANFALPLYRRLRGQQSPVDRVDIRGVQNRPDP